MSEPVPERLLLQRLASGPVSGGVLARESGLTRAAVWKRIDALRAAGVAIDVSPGRGYALRQSLDLLDADAIRSGMPAQALAQLCSLEVAWSVDSTNSRMLDRDAPAAGCAVLLAERQTSGRGRRGRTWASPLAAHVYQSVARRFDGGLARLGGLSLVAGVAACDALHALGFPQVALKWPNDLVVADAGGLRKLGGLLVEGGGEHAGAASAVVGLGLNVRMPRADAAGIDQPWIDLASMASPAPVRNVVVAALLAHMLPALARFDAGGLSEFLPRFAELDALAGRRVHVHVHPNAAAWPATAVGIAEDGALRVRDEQGAERRVHAGDISVRAA